MDTKQDVLDMLREGPKASGDIAAAFDMAWPTITGHLTALKEAGLVEAERDGASIRYRLNISALEEALAFLLDMTGPAESRTPARETKP